MMIESDVHIKYIGVHGTNDLISSPRLIILILVSSCHRHRHGLWNAMVFLAMITPQVPFPEHQSNPRKTVPWLPQYYRCYF